MKITNFNHCVSTGWDLYKKRENKKNFTINTYWSNSLSTDHGSVFSVATSIIAFANNLDKYLKFEALNVILDSKFNTSYSILYVVS